ncbi:hypothetical protein ACHAXR_003110 [Thalassiosira sp. AJA248-18]
MSTLSSQCTSNMNILGGDYTGLSATFSSKSGELVPVPEHLVPESMLEWGEIPSSLEVLNSEVWVDDGDETTMGDLERTTITVLPEVGCGIDNLEVTKKTEKFGHDSRLKRWHQQQQPYREVIAVDRREQKLDLETIFQVDSETDEDGKTCSRRIRLSLSIDIPKEAEDPTLSTLISLQVERQSSPQSSQGTAWTGPSYNSGGLDARTVMNTIGKDIVYGDVFAVKKTKAGGDPWDLVSGNKEEDGALNILDGPWMKTMISTENGDVEEIQRSKSDFDGGEGTAISTIRLPQNILVRYGYGVLSDNKWNIEVSHFGAGEMDNTTCLQRRVVSRSLGGMSGAEEKSLGDVCYWIEKKVL